MSPCLSGVDSWFLSSRSSLSLLHTNSGAGHICGFLFQSRTAWSNLEPTRASCLWWPPQGTSFNLKYLSRFTCHSPLMNLKTKISFKTQEPGTSTCFLLLLASCTWCCILFSSHQAPTGYDGLVAPKFWILAQESWHHGLRASFLCVLEQLPPSVDLSSFLLLWIRAASSFCGLEQLPSENLNIANFERDKFHM